LQEVPVPSQNRNIAERMGVGFLQCILVLCTYSIVLCNVEKKKDIWTPLDWSTLPLAEPGSKPHLYSHSLPFTNCTLIQSADDRVDVWYLVAPLLEVDLGNLLEGLELFHGGVGFTNRYQFSSRLIVTCHSYHSLYCRRTNYSININYDADDFFSSSLFPEVVNYGNGTKDLKWLNQGMHCCSLIAFQHFEGAVYVYEGIYEPYWCTLRLVIGEINGSIYNTYITEHLSKANQTYPFYNLFSVQERWGAQPWLNSWTCFDFVWSVLDILHSNSFTNIACVLKLYLQI
jgi:hypothetical protein